MSLQIKRAEVKMSVLLAQHNVPLALADHLSPLIRDVFDGEVAQGYACAKTKTTCILNGAVAPQLRDELVSLMQNTPYSLSVDGSNDSGLEKMNPLTVRVYTENTCKVETRFLDMCTTSGTDAATARAIFDKMDGVLSNYNIPWDNCVGLGVDNTSVNTGRHNSIISRIHAINQNVYLMGCPCHIAHNTANAAADALRNVTGFDVEELVVDMFYWFDKSTKRKSSLEEYCCFCDVQYRKVVKHVSTRWLSLETAVERVLKLYSGLRSYFASESCSQARFLRLQALFADPLTEVYLMFFQSVLPVFNHFNLFLQREAPCIHLIQGHCQSLLKKVLGRFVKSDVIKDAPSLSEVSIDLDSLLSDRDIFIGFVTRQTLRKLENDGDCSPSDCKKFFRGIRQFYEAAFEYIVAKFPLDDVLEHAIFVNFERRESCNFSDVNYFMDRYQVALRFTANVSDMVFDEFVEYQLLDRGDSPQSVWDTASEELEGGGVFVRMDVLWGFLGSMKTGDGCNLKFQNLSRIAKLVLTLPHSSAAEERVFSLVRLNKTPYRSSLSLDGTLSSILTVKMFNPEPCYKFEPPVDMLEKSKKVTWEYNKEHSTKS